MKKKQLFSHTFNIQQPSSVQFMQQLLNEAIEQHQRGNLQQAEQACHQILQMYPKNADVLHLYGLLLHQKGDHKSAIKYMKRAIKIQNNNPMFFNNLGIVYKVIGKMDEARFAFEKAVRLDKNLADAYNNLGSIYQEQGKLSEALSAYEQALKLNPQYMMAYTNLGNIYLLQDKYEKAREINKQALALDPDFVTAHINLGVICQAEGNFDIAKAHYERAIEIDPKQIDAYTNLANIYLLQDQYEKAREINNKALALDPDFATAHSNLGVIYQAEGNFDLAIDHYKHAIEIDPKQVDAYFGLATLKNNAVDKNKLIAQAEKLLTDRDINQRNKARLHFVLGKLKDDNGSYDEAFVHYKTGNDIKHSVSKYQLKKHEYEAKKLVEYFTPALINKFSAYGSDSELPVFILGMPRSGTTLVEQIISSHPRVRAAGEQGFFVRAANKMSAYLETQKDYPNCLDELNQSTAGMICDEYLNLLTNYSSEALRITDKMTANFLHLGMINMLFPRAHVIHCHRNPVDTCLSIYFQDFMSEVPYAYDLEEIGHYYCQYEHIMTFWKVNLSIPIMDIAYEDLIDNQIEQSRELIEFIGLEWDERCLDFYKTKRAVLTASNWQVRQPVYKSSVNRSEHYLKYITPLIKALDACKVQQNKSYINLY